MTVISRMHPRVPILLLALLALPGCAADEAGEAEDAAAADTMAVAAPDTQAVRVADVGLETPESVLHDEDADVYLVSNINGQPTGKDGNGFISRILPDGTVEELRWIDGTREGITLHAPKGMAVKGDTLFVADIDSVRAFGRTSGEAYGARGVPGATFLNDLAVGPTGTLYVTDSGLNPDFSSSGTDAVYRFDGDNAVALAEGEQLSGPNGIVVDEGSLVVVGFAAAEVRRIGLGGGPAARVATLPGGQLDGVVRLEDGALLVSSWETGTVYRVPAGAGELEAVVEGVPSPADIGWDARRRRVLIPVFTENRLVFHPLPRWQ